MPSKVQLIGGSFQDSQGNLLVNGYLKMRLSADSSVSGVGNICAGVELTILLNSSGSVSTSPTQFVWGNDNLSPVNTFYKVTGYTSQGQPAWGPNNQQVSGTGTFDVGQWIPNSVISWVPASQFLLASYLVASLPAGLVGQIAYATNGRKVGEGVGTGTGVPVYFSNGLWRVYSTDAQVLS